jgi:hypothetical protein
MYNFKPFDYIHVIYVIAIRCNIFSFMNFVFCGVLKVNCKSKISDVSNNYSEFSFLERNSVKARCPLSSDLIYTWIKHTTPRGHLLRTKSDVTCSGVLLFFSVRFGNRTNVRHAVLHVFAFLLSAVFLIRNTLSNVALPHMIWAFTVTKIFLGYGIYHVVCFSQLT